MRQGVLFSIIVICAISCFADTLIVDLAGAGDYSTIQSAIDASTIGDTIIVHTGTYYENISIDKNIVLTSTDPNDLSIRDNTVIDGQQLDQTVIFSGIEDANCVIAGFTITNGLQGIYGSGTLAQISKCHISNNLAEGLLNCDGLIDGCIVKENQGIGLSFCDGGIENCTVEENQRSGIRFCDGIINNSVIINNFTEHYGGGIGYCDGTITNCVISNNHADHNGGGVYQSNDIINCLISNNSTNSGGGGIYDCQGDITNCTIVGNSAFRGGGVFGCEGVIENSIIWYNIATEYDNISLWQIDIFHSCHPEATGETNIPQKPLFKNIYSANPEEWDLHLIAGSPCLDMGTNTVSVELSDMDIDGNPRVQDSDNDEIATIDMGAYECSSSSQQVIALSENLFYFRSNEAKLESEVQYGTFTISNWGPGALNWEVLEEISWLSVDIAEGTSQNRNDITTVTFSVDNTELAPGDYEGTISIVSENCSNSPAVIKVFLTVYQHHLVPSEYSTIQSAINSANDYDKVTVFPGTYNEDLTMNGKNIILSSLNPEDPNIVNNTIIDAEPLLYRSVFIFEGTENEDCLITGFTITGGEPIGTFEKGSGGGIRGYSAKATVSYCVFKNNKPRGGGSAIYDLDGLITDCVIESNSTSYYSNTGAIEDCDGTIRRCLFNNNKYSGIYDCRASIEDCIFTNNRNGVSRGSGTIQNCIFMYNIIGIKGFTGQTISSKIVNNNTGIAGTYEKHDVHNCIIANNVYTGITGSGKRMNCTIIGNGGNGIAFSHLVNSSIIENCIIAFNGNYGLQYDQEFSSSINHCLFYNNSLGLCVYNSNILGEPDRFINTVSELNLRPDCSDNISGDPLILNWQNGDFNLWPDSPCIDSGNPNYLSTGNEKDFNGNPRIIDGDNDGIPVIDIGACEYQNKNTPPVADAGDDQTVYAWIDGYAMVELDGTGSTDADGDVLEYTWYDGNDLIAVGAEPNVLLPVGEHVIDLIVNDGTEDSEPNSCVVTVVEAIETKAKLTPQALNRKSNQPHVIGRLELAGIGEADVDPNEPMAMMPGDIAAERVEVLPGKKGAITLKGFFGHRVLMEAITEDGDVEVTIAAKLLTGQWVYGVDVAKVK